MSVESVAGRHDSQAWRKAQRRGRERGCWVYIAAEQLQRADLDLGNATPIYRVYGGARGNYVLSLRAAK